MERRQSSFCRSISDLACGERDISGMAMTLFSGGVVVEQPSRTAAVDH